MSTAKPQARPTKKTPSAAYKAGLAMRAQVLGPDYVQKAFDNANDLNMPFQEVATEFALGSVWTRPGLSLRDRSLATLSMCIALNRPAELRIHLRGAIRNGITRTELRELLLHSFLYCGGPAALDAYKAVREELPLIEAAEKALKQAAKATAPQPKTKARAPTASAQRTPTPRGGQKATKSSTKSSTKVSAKAAPR